MFWKRGLLGDRGDSVTFISCSSSVYVCQERDECDTDASIVRLRCEEPSEWGEVLTCIFASYIPYFVDLIL